MPGTRANNIPQPFITCLLCLDPMEGHFLRQAENMHYTNLYTSHWIFLYFIFLYFYIFTLREVWRLEKVGIVFMSDYAGR